MEPNHPKNLPKPRTSAKTGKTLFPSEHLEQVHLVAWFRRSFPGVKIFAVPNGGHRGKAEAGRLKAEGVTPGVPDLFIPAWRLWIEMKKQKGGTVSTEQKEMAHYLKCVGYDVLICRGAAAAIDAINEWRKNNEHAKTFAR